MHQVVKRIALALLVAILLALLGGGAALYALTSQLDELSAIQRDKAALAQTIHGRHEELRNLVSEREMEIHRMDLELGQIEALIGLDPSPEADRYERLDTASQTALEKVLMLRSIPSGWPLQQPAVILSGYGWRTHPVSGQRAFHGAADLQAPEGQAVVATADGMVNFAGQSDSDGLGQLVVIQHDFGFRTRYGHLSKIKVKQGDFVRQGEILGRSGATGSTAGPQLHYEVWHLQRRLDPEPFLEWSLSSYDELFEREGRVKWESLAKGIRQRAELLEPQ
nr:M23 family metallopeptidase [Halorhodospira abdelmalekii]